MGDGPEDGHGAGRLTVAEAVEEFLRSRRGLKQAANTLAAYRRDLLGVGEVLARQAGAAGAGRLELSAVSGRALRAAFAEYAEPRAASSVGRAWSVWNQFFTFLVADDLAPGNPMGSVGRPKAPHRFPKPLRGEDTPERLLESAAAPVDHTRRRAPWPERDFAVLAVLLCAGLRSTELLELTVSSVGGRRGERILTVRGKGGKERAVPVEPELEAVIEEYLASRAARFGGREPGRSDPLFVGADGTGLGRGALQYLVSRAYREAGVSGQVPRGASVHALRHTFATRLAEDGASAVEIMRLLGHASLTTSQNYIDATAREQRAAIRASRTSRALRRVAGVPAAGTASGTEASAGFAEAVGSVDEAEVVDAMQVPAAGGSRGRG